MRGENYFHLFVGLLMARSGMTKRCHNICPKKGDLFGDKFISIPPYNQIKFALQKGIISKRQLEQMVDLGGLHCSPKKASDVQWVDYDFPKGQMSKLSPLIIDTAIVRNNGNGKATDSKTFTRAIGLESNFQHEFGVGLKVGTEFSVGVPLVAEATITAEVSTDYRHTWGETNTRTTTVSVTQTYEVPPWSKVKLSGKIQRGTIDVPYTICRYDGELSGGTWQGTDVWDREFIVDTIHKK